MAVDGCRQQRAEPEQVGIRNGAHAHRARHLAAHGLGEPAQGHGPLDDLPGRGQELPAAAVSDMPVVPRSNSATPSSSSSARICAESAGWLTCRRSDARVRCPISATVAKLRSW